MIEHLRSCRNWVFDLDGTLTRPVHDFEHIRAELGIPSGADILAFIAAQDLSEQVRLNQKLDQLEYHYAEYTQPASGVLELLAYLDSRNCNLGILTRNKRDVALKSLQVIGAADYFDGTAVLGRDEAQAKPDPEGIHILFKRWQAGSSGGVMVGDFRYDLEVGRAAGLTTVHVDDRPERQWPELTDLKVGSLLQLSQLLSA